MFPSPTRASLRRFVATGAAVLGATALLATPAQAANGPEHWELSFVDSVSKRPSDIRPDSASFERTGTPAIPNERPYARLVRAGGIIDLENGNSGDSYGSLSRPELLAGDILQVVDSQTGGLYAQATFDGRPSFDPTTCIGTTLATGLRTDGASVKAIGEYANVKHPWRYDGDPTMSTDGLVTAATGGTFAGTFLRPLVAGHLVWAETTLLQSGGVTVSSYGERFVTACPAPPIPPDTLAPAGTATPPKALKKLRDLVKKGFTYSVSTTEAATLNATLTLQTVKGHGKKKKIVSLVVGAYTGPVAPGAAASVNVKVGKAFKSKVKKAMALKGTKLVLSGTLTDAAGNVSTLPAQNLKLPKA